VRRTATLVLADGTVFKASALMETEDVVTGEVVFSTSTTGYTEVLTDPSYYGQIVVLANPEIGNYGVSAKDFQSSSIKVKGLVVRNLSFCASSHRAEMTLPDWLLREQIPVIYGVDTRTLITHIRQTGSMMAALGAHHSPGDLLTKAQQATPMTGQRLSEYVSVTKPKRLAQNHLANNQFHVVVLDFGVKQGILDCLQQLFCEVTVLPGDCSPEEIWAHKPDGLFLSNGPGDPNTEISATATVKAMLGKLPIFGVCLGHQLLAQALGLATYKLKFGHRGSNQAVRCHDHTIITTAQNHGFAVSVPSDQHVADAINISDGTNEGLAAPSLWAFSVQFHPEGSPGPRDALIYFERFKSMVAGFKIAGQSAEAVCMSPRGKVRGGHCGSTSLDTADSAAG